jgi:hypothetical protein
VQSRRKTVFGCDKGSISLHPLPQRFGGLTFGSQDRCGVCAGIDFVTEDGGDKVGALWKVAIKGADADTCLDGDLPHWSVHSGSREYRQSRFQQCVRVPLRVGSHSPIRAPQ